MIVGHASVSHVSRAVLTSIQPCTSLMKMVIAMGRNISAKTDLETRFRMVFRNRHIIPGNRQRARECIRILRAHNNYLALLEKVKAS